MARPKEFDRQQALERAMRLFWSQGYSATSLAQLLETTEIGRSSFYASFRDKRSLFIEVLQLFSERTRAMLEDAWRETHSLAAIPRFFYATLIEVPRARAGRGCLMINTILELSEVDEGLARLASQELAGMESIFEACFREAQRVGDYPGDRSATDLAAHIMILNQGLRVTSRRPSSRKELKCQIDLALSLLELPAVA